MYSVVIGKAEVVPRSMSADSNLSSIVTDFKRGFELIIFKLIKWNKYEMN